MPESFSILNFTLWQYHRFTKTGFLKIRNWVNMTTISSRQQRNYRRSVHRRIQCFNFSKSTSLDINVMELSSLIARPTSQKSLYTDIISMIFPYQTSLTLHSHIKPRAGEETLLRKQVARVFFCCGNTRKTQSASRKQMFANKLENILVILSRKQSRKYLIGRSYKNDEFDWPFDLVIVT